MATAKTQARAPTFFDQVVDATPGKSHLEMCIQCGTCGGSCPSGPDMEHSPRALFAMIKGEMREQVLRSNTPWYCVSCYYCMTRCPQEVHITDLMYTLKRLAIREGFSKNPQRPMPRDSRSRSSRSLRTMGAASSLGWQRAIDLTHHPLEVYKMAPMGLGMLRKGRMDLAPKPIKGVNELKAILNKAKQLEEEEYAL